MKRDPRSTWLLPAVVVLAVLALLAVTPLGEQVRFTVRFRPGVDEMLEEARVRGEQVRLQVREGLVAMEQSTWAVEMAMRPDTHESLKFTDDQIHEVAEIHDQLRAGRRQPFEQGDPDLRQVEKLSHKAWSELSRILDERQQSWLRSVSILFNGMFALADPAVATKLHLSDQQQEQIAEIRTAHRQVARSARRDMREQGYSTEEEMRPRLAQLRAEAEQKLLAVLTPEQQAEFADLQEAARSMVHPARRAQRDE